MDKIIRNVRFMYSICSVCILGMMAHAFRYFNVMYSHDSVERVYIEEQIFSFKVGLGRFTHLIYMPLRDLYSAPWLIGCLSLFFLAITAYLLVDLFDINNNTFIVLLGGIFATNYSLTLINATYVYAADIYMLSILLYTVAIYLLIKYKYGWILGSICVAFALGIYQAYLPMALLVFLFYFMMQSVKNQSFNKQMLLLGKTGIMFGIAAFVYIIIIKYVEKYSGNGLIAGYNGLTAVGDYEGYDILEILKETYLYPLNFFNSITGYNQSYIRNVELILIILTILGFIFIVYKANITVKNKMIIVSCIVALPFVMNSVFLISKGLIHHLMIFHFCMIFFVSVIFPSALNVIIHSKHYITKIIFILTKLTLL